METEVPGAVPSHQSRMWSPAALAADIADDIFLAAITAAPRFCTVYKQIENNVKILSRLEVIPGKSSFLRTVMNSCWSQAESGRASVTLTSSPSFLTREFLASGYWVELWLPQMVTFLTFSIPTPRRAASWERRKSLKLIRISYRGKGYRLCLSLFLPEPGPCSDLISSSL